MADLKREFADLMVEAELREANRRFARRLRRQRISFVFAVVMGLAASVASFADEPSLSRRVLPTLYVLFLLYHLAAGYTPRLFGHPDGDYLTRHSSNASRFVRIAQSTILFGPIFVIFFATVLRALIN